MLAVFVLSAVSTGTQPFYGGSSTAALPGVNSFENYHFACSLVSGRAFKTLRLLPVFMVNRDAENQRAQTALCFRGRIAESALRDFVRAIFSPW